MSREPAPPRALVIGPLTDVPALGAYQVGRVANAAEAIAALADETTYDAVLLDADAVTCSPGEVEALVGQAPLLVVCADADAEHALAWLRRGADDVLGRDELLGAAAQRRLRFARERRAHASRERTAFATDLATGLPHRRQLVEQLSQLLALREREPAPMALIAVRFSFRPQALEGRADPATPASPDDEALRRKIAVRLRAAVRASDLVAAVADDAFVVLLGSLLAVADAERVGVKLAAALTAPFQVAGHLRRLGFAFGISRFPDDGDVADRLLRRALALAEAAPWQGAGAPSVDAAAANDER